MNKELLQRIKELEKKGLNLDLDRGTFSFKLKSTLQPINFERVSGKLSLNEDEKYLYGIPHVGGDEPGLNKFILFNHSVFPTQEGMNRQFHQ